MLEEAIVGRRMLTLRIMVGAIRFKVFGVLLWWRAPATGLSVKFYARITITWTKMRLAVCLTSLLFFAM